MVCDCRGIASSERQATVGNILKAHGILIECWRLVQLADVCHRTIETIDPHADPLSDFAYIDISSIDPTNKVISAPKRLNGKDAPKRARRLVRSGDVLVSTVRPKLNAVALAADKHDGYVCSTAICVLRPKAEILPEYLYWFVRSPEFVDSLSAQATGAVYLSVSDRQIRDQLIPLPPISEQRRIAVVLNDRMEAVEKARKACEDQLEATRELPSVYLDEVFDSENMKNWERRMLGDICREISDGNHFTPHYVQSGVPILLAKNVRKQALSFDDCRYISEEEHQQLCRRCKPEMGDVLYTKVGVIGVAKAVDTDREFSVGVSVAVLKLLPSLVSEYLEMMLNSQFCNNQAERLARCSYYSNLSIRELKQIEVVVPPVSEQQRLVEDAKSRISSYHALLSSLEAQLEAINEIGEAILSSAFRGEL